MTEKKRKYDIVVIGAGVSGAAIARELSRYDCSVCVLEKEVDVCCGTSKANSGIVHAGYDARQGTLKAHLNVRGNAQMDALARDLDIPFVRNGSLVVCTDKDGIGGLEALLENGRKNGVPSLAILSKDEVKAMEPHISDHTVAALYAPTGGIVCPFELNLALAENACANGAVFHFQTEVRGIRKQPERGYRIDTSQGAYEARIIINAAGVYADWIHHMVSRDSMSITARKGEYFLLDRAAGSHVSSTIFTLPGPYGKGVLVTPTVHGNLLVGPTAYDINDKEGTNTTAEGLNAVKEQCGQTVKDIPMSQVITTFAGLRANEAGHDFIIQETVDGFIDCAGIASPGLSSCPAIGEYTAEIAVKKLGLKEKKAFISTRQGLRRPKELTVEERNEQIGKEPAYGTVVCRCEMITEGEIRDAIRRPLGARTMDGVKRRTRAGMGRCQSGFCAPRVMEILAEELGTDLTEITKSGGKGNMLTGINQAQL